MLLTKRKVDSGGKIDFMHASVRPFQGRGGGGVRVVCLNFKMSHVVVLLHFASLDITVPVLSISTDSTKSVGYFAWRSRLLFPLN